MSGTRTFTFLQVSDVHLARPFGWLPPELRRTRRLELREIWRRVVEEAIARRVEALLVPGDLFDGEVVDPETVNRAVECVERPGCPPVFIAPGNHDCYSRSNTYYDNAKLAARGQRPWPGHVHIYTSPEFDAQPLPGRPEVQLWGRCVHANVESDVRVLRNAPFLEPGRIHVGLLHGSRDGFLRPGKRLTAPFSDDELVRAGFDYVALGHYHEPSEIRDPEGRLRAAYSGSPAPLARDETAPHHALEVRVTVDVDAAPERKLIEVATEPVPVDERRLLEVEVDVSGCGSPEATRDRLFEALDRAGARPSDLVRARLAGRTLPGADVVPGPDLLRDRVWFLDLDTASLRPDYDLEAYRLGEPRTTEERFARSLLAEIEDESDPERREVLEAALYYGLDALKQNQVSPRYERTAR